MSAAAAGASGALPGFSFADQCLARMRALLGVDRKRPADAMAFLWDAAFGPKDRRFLARLASRRIAREIELPHDAVEWSQLPTVDRIQLQVAWSDLCRWVRKYDEAAQRWRAEHPVDHYARAQEIAGQP